ncbi:MAG: methylenetetrahydrofolate--tRNA-(uracil(54)-C(5))-methyltransferase (FADH(2)-oxidizing) TrmFO [Candidatus Wallbacteria bacterium HGW-Wallbacteria-1]|jgi:methylenetetrahydrofolate--tRNA-(uracil-5-)-methyltransferase|uniref:Methylenetetrahydrofolate--tRNA-(uracil-5-)-methyltransferase TrmFO n=1 Tax=Candidatus Wallbacteria bacterium HGW-Wallbacteria-1 TaxID=2013854 RepID=A0A2N1PSS9_9BACT|nr:MAG: methylenetetrahydrofolate--tRNA-(uracil(54)-C(5))-methyltransferase (FADH(2)-oxidizing) TrmFO [Candidatus Wallbacteria bacterium HGW-Wallbacteria-1]
MSILSKADRITVIGGGLAGCEAALQLASMGYGVDLLEMRPEKGTPAHVSEHLAELVCSNSLKSVAISNAHGLMKAELAILGSRLMEAARLAAVPAGAALAVDRLEFSRLVGEMISDPSLEGRIRVIRSHVSSLDEISLPAIIATGPLTSEPFMESLGRRIGAGLFFFDAVAPVVFEDSIDMSIAFRGSRYGKDGHGMAGSFSAESPISAEITSPEEESEGTAEVKSDGQADGDSDGDYINCPMNRDEYIAFREALLTAEKANVHGFDRKMVFEGCMPIEEMAERGEDTMRFGPLKPVGFLDPRTGRMPYALVQLRQDNMEGTLFNLVGFQTRLSFGEQKRVFSMIPGLGKSRFARYGVMHRNTYLDSPRVLESDLSISAIGGEAAASVVMAAGQIVGVEGYVESMAMGLLAALFMDRRLKGLPRVSPPAETLMGSLLSYVTGSAIGGKFSPMPANFGLLPIIRGRFRKRELKRRALAERALNAMEQWKRDQL